MVSREVWYFRMTITEATEYINRLKKSGYNNDQIKKILKNSKFSKNDIQGALLSQQLGISINSTKHSSNTKTFDSSKTYQKQEYKQTKVIKKNTYNYSYDYSKEFQKIKLSTIAIILAFVFPIVGLILSIIALKNPGEENKKLARIALYISIMFLFFSFFSFLIPFGFEIISNIIN